MKQTLFVCLLLVLSAGLLSFTASAAPIEGLFTEGQNSAWHVDGLRAVPVSPQNLTITIVNSTDVHLSWQG